MSAILAIFIFFGFLLLILSFAKEKKLSENTSDSGSKDIPNSIKTETYSSNPEQNFKEDVDSLEKDIPNSIKKETYSSNPGQNLKEDVDSLELEQEWMKEATEFYQSGIQKYQLSHEEAASDFRRAFELFSKAGKKHLENPVFYCNLIECSIGFDYDTAINNGYKFFEYLESNNLRFEEVCMAYDVSRKMYKLLIYQQRFEEGMNFAKLTSNFIRRILQERFDSSLEIEFIKAEYFYESLQSNNFSVQKSIVSGLDNPEPWCSFDIENNPEIMNKINSLEQYKKLGDLPRDKVGNIRLTDYHYNILTNLSIEMERTDYFIALKINRISPEINNEVGYYLVGFDKTLICKADINEFRNCEHFLTTAIQSMEFHS